MQVDGYSLDAQKDKLHKYADYQDMIITGEYSDEGKSGKSVEGRPQFQQMSYLLFRECRILVLILSVWKMVSTVPRMQENL
jgi:hypothetical protein